MLLYARFYIDIVGQEIYIEPLGREKDAIQIEDEEH